MSPDGRPKITNLIANFQNENNAERVATALAKWSDEVSSLFLGLQKVEGASVHLDILQPQSITRFHTGNILTLNWMGFWC